MYVQALGGPIPREAGAIDSMRADQMVAAEPSARTS